MFPWKWEWAQEPIGWRHIRKSKGKKSQKSKEEKVKREESQKAKEEKSKGKKVKREKGLEKLKPVIFIVLGELFRLDGGVYLQVVILVCFKQSLIIKNFIANR